MGLLSILSKGLQAMIEEATTPESFKVGQKFEDYTREFIFISDYYDLLEKTHDYNSNSRDYVKSSLKPDFKFRDKRTKQEFYVEVKFRSGLYNNKIEWCNIQQLKRYQEYNKEIPVFVLIGMGEDPEYPEFLSLIPLTVAKYTGLFPSVAEKHEIDVDTALPSKILWNR